MTQREKVRARKLLYSEVRASRIEPKACEKCGSTNSEAHHNDYSKPLDVRWLCKKHHGEAHGHYSTNKSVTVRALTTTREHLRKLAKKRRQTMVVVLDEIVEEAAKAITPSL